MTSSGESPSGRVITFYSYKGGTGRSMMLANVAWLLASAGKRVLTIDWDLEAPGLHRYLYPFLDDKELVSTPGVIDLVIDYAVEAVSPQEGESPPPDDWYLPFADVRLSANALDYPFAGNGTLDFICAGRQDEGYAQRVNTFDWRRFYERLGGWRFIDAFKKSMQREYELILVDSRTGVSDTSGICTVQIPDALVVCFTLNNQSIDGASAVARSVLKNRSNRPPDIFPVPMRIENSEKEKLDARLEYARSKFLGLPDRLTARQREAYWREIEVPYVPYYAYEEVLTAFGDPVPSPRTVLASALALAGQLAGHPIDFAAPERSRRESALLAYQRRQSDRPDQQAPDEIAEAAFVRLPADEQRSAERVLVRLVRLADAGGAAEDAAARIALQNTGEPLTAVRSLVDARLVKIETDPSAATETIQLADPALVQRWGRLRRLIDADREFLLWRQRLGALIATFETSGRDVAALLSGSVLDTAIGHMQRRSTDLNDTERAFITASEQERTTQAEQAIQAKKVYEKEYEQAVETRYVGQQKSRRLFVASGALLFIGAAAVVGFVLTRQARQQNAALAQQFARAATIALGQDSAALALAYADSALAVDSALGAPYYVRGMVYGARDDSALAFANLNRAVSIDSTNTAAIAGRADLRARYGDSTGALRDYGRAVQLDSTDWDVLLGRARVYEGIGNLRSAVDDYSKVITLQPQATDALLSRGGVYQALGDNQRAIADYERVVTTATDSNAANTARVRIARLRPAQVVPRPQTTTGSSATAVDALTVSVLYADAADVRSVINRAVSALQAAGYRTTSSRLTDRDTKAEVRYYRPGDAKAAAQIQEILRSTFAKQGALVPLTVSYRGGSSQQTRRPAIEVVLPALSRYGVPRAR